VTDTEYTLPKFNWCYTNYNPLSFHLSESNYYQFASQRKPNFLSTLIPGASRAAKSLYANYVFENKGGIIFNGSSKAEFKSQCLHNMKAGFNGEFKSIDPVQFEELAQYSAMSMCQEYFQNENFFYDSPPIAFGLLGYGPIVAVVLIEWIGSFYLSFMNEPSFIDGPNHLRAYEVAESIVAKRICNRCEVPSTGFYPADQTKQGVVYTFNGNKHYKIINIARYIGRQNLNNIWQAEWSSVSIFYYHIKRVYDTLKMIKDNNPWDDEVHMFPNCTLAYGRFQVGVISDLVGTKTMEYDDFNVNDYIDRVVRLVIYLGIKGLLYVDIRPQNVRVNDKDVYLIDFDDCVVLDPPPCCLKKLIDIMIAHPHMQLVFHTFPLLQDTLRNTCVGNMCSNCVARPSEPII
jgi:hypothetical protein